jgi:hypothetical protein
MLFADSNETYALVIEGSGAVIYHFSRHGTVYEVTGVWWTSTEETRIAALSPDTDFDGGCIDRRGITQFVSSERTESCVQRWR